MTKLKIISSTTLKFKPPRAYEWDEEDLMWRRIPLDEAKSIINNPDIPHHVLYLKNEKNRKSNNSLRRNSR